MKTLTLISFYHVSSSQRGITYTLNGRKGSCFVPKAIRTLAQLRHWLSMTLGVIVAPPNAALAAFEAEALERLVMAVPGSSRVKAHQIRKTELKSLKLQRGALMASMRSSTDPTQIYTVAITPEGKGHCTCPFSRYHSKACKHQGALALMLLHRPEVGWERREVIASPSLRESA